MTLFEFPTPPVSTEELMSLPSARLIFSVAVRLISPVSPSPLVVAMMSELVRLICWALGMVIFPASPVPDVEAVMVEFSKTRLSVWIVMLLG